MIDPTKRKPDMPTYLSLVVATVAVWGAAVSVVSVADFLQPAFPALLVLMPVAIIVGIICFYERTGRPEWKNYFDRGLAFAALVVVGSISMIAAQRMIEGGEEKGAIAVFLERYKPSATDNRQIPTQYDTAKRKITRANYTPDNKGFIKAIARSEGVIVSYFKELGIDGDAKSLQDGLASYPVSSNEYRNLADYMTQAHSEHYSRPIRQHIIDLITDAEKRETSVGIRHLACESKSTEFIAVFVQRSLAKYCEDEGRWVAAVIDFAKNAMMPLGELESYMWWTSWARNRIKYTPTNITRVSATAHVIQYADLLTRTAPVEKYLKIDGKISFIRARDGSTGVYIFDPSSGLPEILLQYEGSDIAKLSCWMTMLDSFDWSEQNRKPKCTARLTLYRPTKEDWLKILAVEKVVVLH